MTTQFNSGKAGWLVAAGMVFAIAAAGAAKAAVGCTVTPKQETQVAAGMTSVQVQSILGSPTKYVRYSNEPRPTWTYGATGVKDTLFDVDFGLDDKVASVAEH